MHLSIQDALHISRCQLWYDGKLNRIAPSVDMKRPETIGGTFTLPVTCVNHLPTTISRGCIPHLLTCDYDLGLVQEK
jgi:hypothetical protein